MTLEAIEQVAGYPGLFIICAMAGMPIPIPEDVPLLYAGIRISSGEWAIAPTLLAAMSGVYLRDAIAYGIGRALGDYVLHGKWVGLWIGRSKLDRAQRLINKYGYGAVLMGRFLVGFRAPVFLVAGAMGMRRRDFFFWDLTGLVVAVPGMIAIGYGFGPPVIDVVMLAGRRFREAAVVGVIALLIVWLAVSIWQRRSAT